MNVGIFTDSYFPQVSGVATSIKTLKEALEKKGHKVYIFTTTDPQVRKEEKNIIRMPSVPFISFKDRRIIIRGMIAAYRLARELKLDIIHTQTEFGVGILGKMVARQLKIPCVHTYHTMYEDYLHYIANGKLLKKNHVKLYSRAFSKHLSGIICPSLKVVHTLKSYGIEAPLKVIPTGIDLDSFVVSKEKVQQVKEKLPIKKEDILLLSLSRLSYEKNIQETLYGFQYIQHVLPQTKLLIVGKGPYLEELQNLVHTLKLEKSVLFLGEISHQEVPYYYHLADYFVSCSTSESQGLTYTEALACELPCIVWGNSYIEELLSDESFGATFYKAEAFPQTFIDFYTSKKRPEKERIQEKLYPMSAEKFVLEVLDFYQKAQHFYEQKSEQTTLKRHLSLKRGTFFK